MLMREAKLWDYFAANALAGACSNEQSCVGSPADIAHWAAEVADSMLIQRKKREGRIEELENA